MRLATLLLITLFGSLCFAGSANKTSSIETVNCLYNTISAYDVKRIEPCAWEYAKEKVSESFPDCKRFIEKIQPDYTIEYSGCTIPFNGTENYGLTSPDGKIQVYLCNDVEENIDTIVHEFTHNIEMKLLSSGVITDNLYQDMYNWTQNERFWGNK